MPDSALPQGSRKRKTLSKKARFAVLARDQFACQYCGGKAPDVLLHVDHIEAVVRGGGDDILNLITSCIDCNFGKGTQSLSENSILGKQRRQLDELASRREQLQMMFQWQRSLTQLADDTSAQLADHWASLVAPFHLTKEGLRTLKKHLRKYDLQLLMEAMAVAVEEYVIHDDEGKPTEESVEHAWQKVSGICSVRKVAKEKPYLKQVLYIRGILRNRLSYCDEHLALKLLEKCARAGIDLDSMTRHAKGVRNWTAWRTDVEEWLEDLEESAAPEAQQLASETPQPSSESPNRRFGQDNHYYEVTYDDLVGVSITEVGQGTVLSCEWGPFDIGGYEVPCTAWISPRGDGAAIEVELHWAKSNGPSPELLLQLLARPFHYLAQRADVEVTKYESHLELGHWARLAYSFHTPGRNLGDESEEVRGFHETVFADAIKDSSTWPPPVPIYFPTVEVALSREELTEQRLEDFQEFTQILVADSRPRIEALEFAIVVTGDTAFPYLAWNEHRMAQGDHDSFEMLESRVTEWISQLEMFSGRKSLLILPPDYSRDSVKVGYLLVVSADSFGQLYETMSRLVREIEELTRSVLYRHLTG